MRTALFLILLAGFTLLQGQNLLDDQGRRTGPWKVDYPGGSTRYEGTFLEGDPVGEMIHYYENGAVRARMWFGPDRGRSYAELFHENGSKAAEGIYLNQLKDSVWTYFSEFDGTIRLKEPYAEGKIHGAVRKFYPSGAVSEEVSWSSGLKEGPWKQYYEDGAVRLSSGYENDMMNGSYEVFGPDGTLWVSGLYLDNLSQGTWRYFDDKGSEVYTIEFRKGLPVDQEEYLKIMQDTLIRYNLNIEPDQIQYE